tara:strand:+ start:1626 stop:1907 length:282 start_codon:yes stop_codon:yes gene_type:complete
MSKLDDYIGEAIQNVRKDREVTKKLLGEIILYLSADDNRYRDAGAVAAKYVETLQRSNEQLVKIAALVQKKSGAERGLTDEDKSELFDLIKEN